MAVRLRYKVGAARVCDQHGVMQSAEMQGRRRSDFARSSPMIPIFISAPGWFCGTLTAPQ
jgi:hypothetical protein